MIRSLYHELITPFHSIRKSRIHLDTPVMSFLRQLPEFTRARELVKHHNWSSAASQFARCSEIMTHANQARDSGIANLYAGTCNFYLGDMNQASSLFSSSTKSIESTIPHLFKLSSDFETHLSSGDGTAWSPSSSYSDPWVQLALSTQPSSGFPKQVWEFVHTGNDFSDIPSSGAEFEAVAWANLRRAYTVVSKLPKANSTGVSIDKEIKLVNLSLKAGEKIRSLGDEHDIIGVWYVGNSLLLRGRLFEFNANALMAEGMYRAAGDLVRKFSNPIPRMALLSRMANNHLGDLLLRWEKREQEGKRLLESNQIPSKSLIEESISSFSALPKFEDLDSLE